MINLLLFYLSFIKIQEIVSIKNFGIFDSRLFKKLLLKLWGLDQTDASLTEQLDQKIALLQPQQDGANTTSSTDVSDQQGRFVFS